MPDNPSDPDGVHIDQADVTGSGLPEGSIPGECAGDVVERYTLIEEVGEGGMGTVWRASQTVPVVREVALKIIKLGMDTREVVGRFEAERQALAMMDHAYVAKMLDGGATVVGRPYFVMELVKGDPITTWCDEHQLGLPARLELFIKVCEAIQHAHQKGIIHRDIKPSNVLVSETDGVANPKVIDFGIAKATRANLPEQTILTRHGSMIGTPEYMAPEQAAPAELDVDTRADVYSLGVLLYELLTGTKPFDIRTAIASGIDELLRTIREVDPALPSTRVSTLGDSATPIAEQRQVSVGALSKHLRGDLDWIVMRAIEKDRERRYETASGLAADVRRFLDQEPVLAAPPRTTYRLRKFVRRRKKTVVTAAAILMLVLAGLIGTGVGWWRTTRANRALDIALNEKSLALVAEERQRTLAEANEKRAREAQAELEQVATFQNAQLSTIDPATMGIRLRRSLIDAAPEDRRDELTESLSGLNFTNLALGSLKDNLFGRTIAAIDSQFADQPLVQAQLLQTVATTLRNLGLLEAARDPQSRALKLRRAGLGDEHPDTIQSIVERGWLFQENSQGREARRHFAEALDAYRRTLGDVHPKTLETLCAMGAAHTAMTEYAQAEPYYREALETSRRVLGDDHAVTATATEGLGSVLRSRSMFAEAEVHHREALAIQRRIHGDVASATLDSLSQLGMVLRDQRKYSEAEPCFREVLEARRHVLGDEHPATLSSLYELGSLFLYQEKYSEAEPYLREALESQRRVLGDEDLQTLASMGQLGRLLNEQGDYSAAEPLFREALETSRRVLGERHRQTLFMWTHLGLLLERQGKFSQARDCFVAYLSGFRQAYGNEHALTRDAIRVTGEFFLDRVAHERNLVALGSDDRSALAEALADYGAHQLEQGMHIEAETSLTESLDLLLERDAEMTPRSAAVMNNLGLAIAGQGRFEEAEAILLESGVPRQSIPFDFPHPESSTGD